MKNQCDANLAISKEEIFYSYSLSFRKNGEKSIQESEIRYKKLF